MYKVHSRTYSATAPTLIKIMWNQNTVGVGSFALPVTRIRVGGTEQGESAQ